MYSNIFSKRQCSESNASDNRSDQRNHIHEAPGFESFTFAELLGKDNQAFGESFTHILSFTHRYQLVHVSISGSLVLVLHV